jgi:hypothetical protein
MWVRTVARNMTTGTKGHSEMDPGEEPLRYPAWYPWLLRGETDPLGFQGEQEQGAVDRSEAKPALRRKRRWGSS